MTVNVDFAPQGCDLETLAAMACRRWAIEHACKAAKQDTGLDTSGVCSTVGRYRYVTLALWALEPLAMVRAVGPTRPPNLCQVELRQQVPVLVWSRPP